MAAPNFHSALAAHKNARDYYMILCISADFFIVNWECYRQNYMAKMSSSEEGL